MRLLALSIVVLVGAALVAVDSIPGSRGNADDLGPFTLVAGLIALGVELYVLPVVKRKHGRD